MIAIAIAAKNEWKVVLEKFKVEDCIEFSLGQYFIKSLYGEDVIFYHCGSRKMRCSASTQYMIDHFELEKIIVVGTCAGIDNSFKKFDIFFPNKFVQYDCTVKETEPLIKDSYTVELDISNINNINDSNNIKTGTLATADKPVVTWKDYEELKENDITIADMEAAAIIYICKANNVECVVIKGISDFPLDESKSSKQESYDEQLNIYMTNTPIVLNNILDNYLEFAIKNSFKYKE